MNRPVSICEFFPCVQFKVRQKIKKCKRREFAKYLHDPMF